MCDIPRLYRLGLAATVFAIAACNSVTDAKTNTKPQSDLTFLRPAPGSPALVDSSVSFYAVKGQDREVHLLFANTGGEEYVRFKVPSEALYKRPDGTLFAAGDSILITVSVVDPTKVMVDFQPSGLKFDPAHPASLRINFGEADDDYNDDGVVNSADTAVVPKFAIWHSESGSTKWTQNSSLVSEEFTEVEGEINGFSNYAIAY